jgi:hypothetical protein
LPDDTSNPKRPEPLTPADCDLRDFQYMELDVRRLRDSKFAATPNGDAFRAGILLWCAAWHQVPAGSLPDDDVELAQFAGFGRMPVGVREWKKLRKEAMAGFVECSDGRLYHTVVAEKALQAWDSRLHHHYDKWADRIRKENKKRKEEGLEIIPAPTFEQWISAGRPADLPPEFQKPSAGIPPPSAGPSAGNPAENALKGNGEGEGEGEGDIFSSGEGGKPPARQKRLDPVKEELWRAGKSVLTEAGVSKDQAGSFLGKLVQDYGQPVVLQAVRAAVAETPPEPRAYLKATCQRLAGERSRANGAEDWTRSAH